MQKYLKSNNLKFELVQESDAKFILELRSNKNLNKYLSKSVITEEAQKEWIRKYKEREQEEKEFYFRVDTKNGEKLGFIRIYDIDKNQKSFTWGSWILKEDKPIYAAIESVLIIYEFAFNYLGLIDAKLDVRKKNTGVSKFHSKFGMRKYKEDELNEYYTLSKEDYVKLLEKKYKKYL